MQSAGVSRRTIAQIVAAGVLVLAMGTVTAGAALASTNGVTTKSAAGADVKPPSANTCNGAVCIYVTGSGLNVSDWSTSVSLSKTMCTTADFWVNGVLFAQGQRTCGVNDDLLVADWSDPGNFANGTVLCNTWSGVSGEPCITVHS